MNIKPETLCIAHSGIISGTNVVTKYLHAAFDAAESYREMLERSLKKHNDDVDKVVEEITRKEYDIQSEPGINRNPYMTNLRAKTQAVMRLRDQ